MFQVSFVVSMRVSGFAQFIRKIKWSPVRKCGVEMDSRLDNPGRAAEVSEECRGRSCGIRVPLPSSAVSVGS